MELNNQIGNRIRSLRESKDPIMTMEALAWQSGISKSTLFMLETGRSDVKISTLAKICRTLGVSLEEFSKGIDENGL
ncbi:MAG: helix-turn-helix transcriptional regulator [Candidatus Gastranaerophilales bacterium]|nr:helix-turn-helix transcriptional regulator [Candidatus Gastranaerophilales bacterium]